VEYLEIGNEEDIPVIIDKIRGKYGSWRQIIIPTERETTMSGKMVVTLFLRFDPICKIEGEPEIIEQFLENFQELCAEDA
jgi:hypothetical protein